MRSYDDVDFRPWYLPDTARWLQLSLGARGLVAELVRKLDRHGRIALGEDPAADLAIILRLDGGDTRKALDELIGAGRVVWDAEARVLIDPDLPARLRQGSASRMASKRARDKAAATAPISASPDLDPDSVTSRHARHISSPSDLICSDLISDLKIPEEIPSAREPERPPTAELRPLAKVPDPSGPPPDWWPDVLATIHVQTSVLLPAGESWLAYAGHRASPSKRLPATREDALYWLTRVEVPAARKVASEAARTAARDARWDAERKAAAGAGPPPGGMSPAVRGRQPTPEELTETRRLARMSAGLFAVPKTGTNQS